MSPGPAPSYPMPVPYPYPGPVYVYPGGGGSLGVAPVLVFFGLFLLGVWMVRGLSRAGEGVAPASVGRLRLALLVRPEVQRAIRRLAEAADTTTAKGLADLVDEMALLLLKEEPAWHFASYEASFGDEERVLALFDAWMLEDRSTYQETFRHFEGKKVATPYTPRVEPGGRYLGRCKQLKNSPQIRTLFLFHHQSIQEHKTSRRVEKEVKERKMKPLDTEEELWGFALGHPWVHFTPFASFAALREVLCSRINRERKSERVRICGCFSAVCTSTPPPSPTRSGCAPGGRRGWRGGANS
jgi:hypothetical protein